MTLRSFLLLFGATILAIVITGLSLALRPGDFSSDQVGERLVPDLAGSLNDVQTIKVGTKELGTLTLNRDGGTWVLMERGGFPAKAELVNRMLLQLSELTYLAPKTANPDLYEHLDLRDPSHPESKSAAITVLNKDGDVIGALVTGTARTGLAF